MKWWRKLKRRIKGAFHGGRSGARMGWRVNRQADIEPLMIVIPVARQLLEDDNAAPIIANQASDIAYWMVRDRQSSDAAKIKQAFS